MGTVSFFSSDGVSNSTLYSTLVTQQTAQAAQATAEQDQVKLSAAAQAQMLYKQGESVNAIAQVLGTTAKTIDEYLGITEEKALQQIIAETAAIKA
jgi:predicted transcriptional regulator